jgi:hypothetical protein
MNNELRRGILFLMRPSYYLLNAKYNAGFSAEHFSGVLQKLEVRHINISVWTGIIICSDPIILN